MSVHKWIQEIIILLGFRLTTHNQANLIELNNELQKYIIDKILFGEASPSGKLPVTVPRNIVQLPFHYSMKNINYKKEYLFIGEGSLYPFGHGLSYVDFKYNNLTISKYTMEGNGTIMVNDTVTNQGNMMAKESVQLYITDKIGSVMRAAKELKGFEKFSLNPGESSNVSIEITPDMLVFTRMDMTFGIESGDYEVMVGTSSEKGLKGQFYLDYSK